LFNALPERWIPVSFVKETLNMDLAAVSLSIKAY